VSAPRCNITEIIAIMAKNVKALPEPAQDLPGGINLIKTVII
jgi:hypothetical protein